MENSNPSFLMTQNSLTNSKEAIDAVEKHEVIWHDPYLYSSTKLQYIRAIKLIRNVKLFVNLEEALRYLKKPRQVFYYVITSGEQLIKEISKMSNITSIYVLCEDVQAPLAWIEQYPKVVCAENEFTLLLKKIYQDIATYEGRIPSIMHDQPNKEQQEERQGKKEEPEEIDIKTSVNEMVKCFVKENQVIWYDPKVDSTENINKRDELKQFCDIQTFTDWKKASKYLKETQISLCQVIISGTNAESLAQQITDLKCISSIYILCEDKVVMFKPSWIDHHRKVIHIEHDFKSIANKMKIKIEKWSRTDLPSFASIFDDMDRSEENYRHIYLRGLSQFENRKQAKRDFLDLAKAFYATKQDIRNLMDFEHSYADYGMKSILNWYTKECFLYKLTNNCLRIASLDSIQYCRLILRDLETAIKEKYKQNSHNFVGLLYRGAYMSAHEWLRLKQNVGKDIEMHGFLSTTKNKHVANAFSQEDLDQKAFITIIVPNAPAKDEQGFAEMKEYSDTPDEDEVLFNIRSRFTILEANIDEIEGSKMRHLVLLYGAQPMRIFTRFEDPATKIQLQNTQIGCSVCQQQIMLNDDSVLGITINHPHKYTCHSCLKNLKMSKSQPLLCIKPSALTSNLTVGGSVIQNKGNWNIEFYGYKCQICLKSKSNGFYTCIGCQERKISYCNKCFFDEQNNKCDKEGHIIIFEGRPFSFWSEKISEKEVHRLNYQMQESVNTKAHFNKVDIFLNTHNYQKGIEFCQRSLIKNSELKDQIGTNKSYNESLLYNDLGSAYASLGEYQEAINCYYRCLNIYKTVFKDNHVDTAASYNNIGSAYHSLGEYQKAIDYISQALEIYTYKAMGEDNNQNRAIAFSNLGTAFEALGKYQEAINYHSLALEINNTLFGDNHPSTAHSYNNLGLTYGNLGEYQKAIKYHSKALEINKEVFGDSHPNTTQAFNNLGLAYKISGEYQKALDYYSRALEINKRIFGDMHPTIASLYENIGSTHQSLGEYQKAKEFYSLSLEVYKVVFGDNHPSTAHLYNKLGLAYRSLGEHKKAIEYYSQALKLSQAVLGDKHPNIAVSYHSLGLAYKDLGEYQKAIDYFFKALKINKEVFGDNHPSTARSYKYLGSTYENLGEYQESIKCHSKGLEINKKVFGDNHSETAASYNDFGLAYQGSGEYYKAIDHHIQAVKICKIVFGNNHPDTATSYDNLGSAYEMLGEYQKAIEYHSQALKIKEIVLGDKHPSTATSYSNLGIAYQDIGEYQKAIDHFFKALKINKDVFGDNHPDIAASYNGLGLAYKGLGEYRKAIDHHVQSIDICKVVFGENHPNTAASYNNLGLTYQNLGEYQKAIDNYFLALDICKVVFGNKHKQTAILYTKLGSIYQRLRKYCKASQYYLFALEVYKLLDGDKNSNTGTPYSVCMLYSCFV